MTATIDISSSTDVAIKRETKPDDSATMVNFESMNVTTSRRKPSKDSRRIKIAGADDVSVSRVKAKRKPAKKKEATNENALPDGDGGKSDNAQVS